jgi:hypothetical protein
MSAATNATSATSASSATSATSKVNSNKSGTVKDIKYLMSGDNDFYRDIDKRIELNSYLNYLQQNPNKWAKEIEDLKKFKRNLPTLEYTNIRDFITSQRNNGVDGLYIAGDPQDKEDASLVLPDIGKGSQYIDWYTVQHDLKEDYGIKIYKNPNDSDYDYNVLLWSEEAPESLPRELLDMDKAKPKYKVLFDEDGVFKDGFKERIAMQKLLSSGSESKDLRNYLGFLRDNLKPLKLNNDELQQQGKKFVDEETGRNMLEVEIPYEGKYKISLEKLNGYNIMNSDRFNKTWDEEAADSESDEEEAAASAPVGEAAASGSDGEAAASASDTQYKTSVLNTHHGTSAPEKETHHYHIPIELKDIVNQIKYCDKLEGAKNDIEHFRDTNKFTELVNAEEEAAGYAKLTEDTFYIRHSDLKSLFGVEKKINAKYTYNTNRLRGIMSIDYEATSKEIEDAFAKYNIKIVPDETAPRSYRDATDDSILNPFANSSQRTRQPGNTDNLGFEEAYNIVEQSANGWRRLREIEAQSTRRKQPIPYQYAVIQEAKKILDRSNPSDESYKPTRKQLKDEAESRKILDDAQREASEAQETRDEEQRKALSEQGSVLRPDRVKPVMPINISNMPKESTWSNLVKSTGTGTGTGIGTGTGKSKKSDTDQVTYDDDNPNKGRRQGNPHNKEPRESKAIERAQDTLVNILSKGMPGQAALNTINAHENFFRDNRNRRGHDDNRENYSEEHEVFCVRSIGRRVLNKKKRMRRMTPLIKSLKQSLKRPSKKSKKSLKRPSKKHSKKSKKSLKRPSKKHSKKSTKKKHSKKSSKKKALKKYRFSV